MPYDMRYWGRKDLLFIDFKIDWFTLDSKCMPHDFFRVEQYLIDCGVVLKLQVHHMFHIESQLCPSLQNTQMYCKHSVKL